MSNLNTGECKKKESQICQKVTDFKTFGYFYHMERLQYDTIGICPSHPSWEVEFACESSMVAQVKGAEDLPDTQHVALRYILEGPGILVVLFHVSLILLQRS